MATNKSDVLENKKAAVTPLKSVIAITIEQIPTAYHSDKRPQGDNAPYDNCQPLSNTHRVGDLFGYKDTNISINNLKKLINNWNISDEKSFVYFVANCIGAEPSIERQKRANKAEEISYYLNLPQYSLRIGLHNLNAENYTGVRNRPMNHGVTLKDLRKKDTFKAKKGVKVKEYVYIYWTERRLKNISKSILHLLETGIWDKTIAEPDYTNPITDKNLSGLIYEDYIKQNLSLDDARKLQVKINAEYKKYKDHPTKHKEYLIRAVAIKAYIDYLLTKKAKTDIPDFKTLIVGILTQNGYTNGKDYTIRYYKSSPFRANRGEKNIQECWIKAHNTPSSSQVCEDDFDDIESLTDYVCGLVDLNYYSKKETKSTHYAVGDLIS